MAQGRIMNTGEAVVQSPVRCAQGVKAATSVEELAMTARASRVQRA
jgi:hypothetical protein